MVFPSVEVGAGQQTTDHPQFSGQDRSVGVDS